MMDRLTAGVVVLTGPASVWCLWWTLQHSAVLLPAEKPGDHLLLSTCLHRHRFWPFSFSCSLGVAFTGAICQAFDWFHWWGLDAWSRSQRCQILWNEPIKHVVCIWNRMRPKALVWNQQTRELISSWKMSHKRGNKGPSHLWCRWFTWYVHSHKLHLLRMYL